MMNKDYRNIVILTGAGVSAESGVPTFRASDGLWEGHRIEDVATPEAYARDPETVLNFYNQRRAALKKVQPNKAHHALAELEQLFHGHVTLVTQNVDDLHERAGSKNIIHMHGELLKIHCARCTCIEVWHQPQTLKDICRACGETGRMRPDIVWFGEMPYQMDRINDALQACDLFLVIGTSSQVYPAAGFIETVRYFNRAHTVELNLDSTQSSTRFHDSRLGPATRLVPEFINDILKDKT
jgi:NAD-dependent deacetylase